MFSNVCPRIALLSGARHASSVTRRLSTSLNVVFRVEGMNCAACVGRVEKQFQKIQGVKEANVDLLAGRAVVKMLHDTDTALIADAVTKAGYVTHIVRETEKVNTFSPFTLHLKDLRRRFAVTSILTTPFLVMHVGHALPSVSLGLSMPWWMQAMLATPAVLYGAAPMMKNSWKQIHHGETSMDTLISLGLSAAYAGSWLSLLSSGGAELYFDASCMITSFVLLGRFLEARAKDRAWLALNHLSMGQVPSEARLLMEDGTWTKKGDKIVLFQGDTVPPVDGTVVDGGCSVTEAQLTGEGRPVEKESGSKILGGSRVVAASKGGRVVVHVDATEENTVVGKIRTHVSHVQASKPRVQLMADRIAGVFVPVVVALAGMTTFGWMASGASLLDGLTHATAVLVIACPCALGLATPMVVQVVMNRASSMGILFRDAQVLETARKIGHVAFDKTGTLTTGNVEVVDVHWLVKEHDRQRVLSAILALEERSDHPFASALMKETQAESVDVEFFRSESGQGLEGKIGPRTYRIGTRKFVGGAKVHPYEKIDGISSQVYISEDAQIVAQMSVLDTLRPTAARAVQGLHSLGIQTSVISGDQQQSVENVAKVLQMDTMLFQATPAEKELEIQRLAGREHARSKVIGMVGDGVNDALALAKADVGFAMGQGTAVALDAADITLVKEGDLEGVMDVINLSERAARTIRQNLVLAGVYNLCALPLAAVGFVSPVLGAAAMSLSSIAVVSNSMLLLRWKRSGSIEN